MDYLLGIVVLLGMAALPGRVALQNPKRSIPRLRLSYNGSYLVEMKTVPPGGRSMCVQPTETSVYLTEQPRRPSSGQPECAEEFKELVKQPDNYSLQSNYAGPPISLPWPAPSWD
ncbi:semaphorin-3aa [Tachysurus ichikawai]